MCVHLFKYFRFGSNKLKCIKGLIKSLLKLYIALIVETETVKHNQLNSKY